MSSRPIRRTYSSRNRTKQPPSSPISNLDSSPSPQPASKKRPLGDSRSSFDNIEPSSKRAKLSFAPSTQKSKTKLKKKTYTQLHFNIDQTTIRTCSLCNLSYTKGAAGDESLHKAHCARVQRGMEWGKEDDKDAAKADLTVIASNVRLKDGKRGRIIRVKSDAAGKIGSKTKTLQETINVALSAPALPSSSLQACKMYLFLIPSSTNSAREKIVGCVMAQRISTAMAIATPQECLAACSDANKDQPPAASPTATLVAVDTSTGIFCHPAPLPTAMGIPRLFVPSSHRRLGIATKLLTAAAETFIHGCPLDPAKGEVAFSQPTGDGNAVMRRWGSGGVRIYEE